MDKKLSVAQWVIDNRYPKSEKEKVSDHEIYQAIKDIETKLEKEQANYSKFREGSRIVESELEQENLKLKEDVDFLATWGRTKEVTLGFEHYKHYQDIIKRWNERELNQKTNG